MIFVVFVCLTVCLLAHHRPSLSSLLALSLFHRLILVESTCLHLKSKPRKVRTKQAAKSVAFGHVLLLRSSRCECVRFNERFFFLFRPRWPCSRDAPNWFTCNAITVRLLALSFCPITQIRASENVSVRRNCRWLCDLFVLFRSSFSRLPYLSFVAHFSLRFLSFSFIRSVLIRTFRLLLLLLLVKAALLIALLHVQQAFHLFFSFVYCSIHTENFNLLLSSKCKFLIRFFCYLKLCKSPLQALQTTIASLFSRSFYRLAGPNLRLVPISFNLLGTAFAIQNCLNFRPPISFSFSRLLFFLCYSNTCKALT